MRTVPLNLVSFFLCFFFFLHSRGSSSGLEQNKRNGTKISLSFVKTVRRRFGYDRKGCLAFPQSRVDRNGCECSLSHFGCLFHVFVSILYQKGRVCTEGGKRGWMREERLLENFPEVRLVLTDMDVLFLKFFFFFHDILFPKSQIVSYGQREKSLKICLPFPKSITYGS